MNRLLAGLLAAVMVVTGCAGQDPTRQTLNEHVGSIRDAAAAGDLDAAQHELDQLQALVRQAVEEGELDQQRADAILAAAATVDQELSALAQPPDPPPTDRQPPDRHEHEDDERDKEDKEDKDRDRDNDEKNEKEEEHEKEELDEDEDGDEDD